MKSKSLSRRLIISIAMLIVSAVLLSTASFAWFSMNVDVRVTGMELEAYSDSIFIEISQDKDNKDSYASDTEVSYHLGVKQLRPVTFVNLATENVYTIVPTPVTGNSRYDDTTDDVDYYLKASAGSGNDSYEGDNYIKATVDNGILFYASRVSGYYKADNIEFEMVKSGTGDGSTSYLQKMGSRYNAVTPAAGESLVGYYTVDLVTAQPQPDGARYDGVSVYYSTDADGNYFPVGGLTLGAELNGLYTIEKTQVRNGTVSDGTQTYHIMNDRGDYVSIGNPGTVDDEVVLSDYLCWARTYSNSYAASNGGNNTLKVIKPDRLDVPQQSVNDIPYHYYYDGTFYIRTVANTDMAKNLRVSEISIKGDDDLTNSLRVLFVAENGDGEVAYADYNNGTGRITHREGGILFDHVLGNAEEVITVDVYVYYDGTDNSVKTQGTKISGHKVEIKFEVDEQEHEA